MYIRSDIENICAQAYNTFGYQLFCGSCGMFAMALGEYLKEKYNIDSKVKIFSFDECEDFVDESGFYGHAVLQVNIPSYDEKGNITNVEMVHVDGAGILNIEDVAGYQFRFGRYTYIYNYNDVDHMNYTYMVTSWFATHYDYLDFIWNSAEEEAA